MESGSGSEEDLDALVSEALGTGLVPTKSATLYEKHFKDFAGWCSKHDKDVKQTDGVILCAYFQSLKSNTN